MEAAAFALVVTRLVQFAAAMILVGAPALGWVADAAAAGVAGRAEFRRWQRSLLLRAAAAALVSAAVWLGLEAANMGGAGWASALDPATLATVLGATQFGRAWSWHLALVVALLVGFAAAPAEPTRLWRAVGLLLAASFAAGLAWAGHAAMRGAPSLAAQVVHILAASLWLGSLPPLFWLVARARAAPGDWARVLDRVLPRYSAAGMAAVALILVTGCLNASYLVGQPAALVTSLYGRVLLVKVELVLLMVAVAANNRFRLMPRLGAGAAAGGALAALHRAVAIEQALALAVLAAVGLLGTLPPAIGP